MTLRFLACLAALAAGCGGTTWINKDYRGAVPTGSDRPLLLPIDVHQFPDAMKRPLEELVDREVSGAFASRAVRMHALRDQVYPAGLGNVSWQLPIAMHRRAREEGKKDLAGRYHDWMEDLPDRARRLGRWARPKLEPTGSPKAGFRYLIGANLERLHRPPQDRLTFRLVVGVYDTEKQRIAAVAWIEKTVERKLEAVKAALAGTGQRAVEALGPVLGP
jgi:hypothetical protein